MGVEADAALRDLSQQDLNAPTQLPAQAPTKLGG